MADESIEQIPVISQREAANRIRSGGSMPAVSMMRVPRWWT